MSYTTKKILIILLIVIILIYFLWESDLFKRMRGVDNAPATQAKSSDKLFNVQPAAPKNDDKFPLKIDSRGENVTRLQKALNTINSSFPYMGKYETLVTDGTLGRRTYEAVLLLCGTAYWSHEGLTQTKWNEIIARANNLTAVKK